MISNERIVCRRVITNKFNACFAEIAQKLNALMRLLTKITLLLLSPPLEHTSPKVL